MQRVNGRRSDVAMLVVVVILNSIAIIHGHSTCPMQSRSRRSTSIAFRHSKFWTSKVALWRIRGGSTEDENDSTDTDVESIDEEYDHEDEEFEADDDDEADEDEYDVEEYDGDEKSQATSLEEFDEPYFMPPTTQLYATFGCIMLSQRIDLFSPLVVRIIRFAFIAQILIQQIFVVYVRIMAKKKNDRTSVTTQNPLSGVLQSQLANNEASSGMVKSLASSFLTSETTVMEYDMKEAKSMQGGVVFNMAFMWFLHFKMEQVQPLLIQVVTGFMQLAYSPLFQVYVLGRNLERPFKSPPTAAQKSKESKITSEDSEDDDDTERSDETDDEEEASGNLDEEEGGEDAGEMEGTESTDDEMENEQEVESSDDET